MRWNKLKEWGESSLRSDEWAPLSAEISSPHLEAVEQTLEDLTGFMDFFRETIEGAPITGVTDGQLAVAHRWSADARGKPVLNVDFYASGPVDIAAPDAFQRLAKAANSLVDELQAEGVAVEAIQWTERPYVKRPF